MIEIMREKNTEKKVVVYSRKKEKKVWSIQLHCTNATAEVHGEHVGEEPFRNKIVCIASDELTGFNMSKPKDTSGCLSARNLSEMNSNREEAGDDPTRFVSEDKPSDDSSSYISRTWTG